MKPFSEKLEFRRNSPLKRKPPALFPKAMSKVSMFAGIESSLKNLGLDSVILSVGSFHAKMLMPRWF
jgi:hypothetical protein